MGRRRCPICRSREWHKEPSSGLVTCSEGHVLQNYWKETNETTEVGPHALHKRTLKSNRVGHAFASRANDILYHGARARYFYFECLQLLLRKQVAALTVAWDLPPEFEIVCKDLWALHLSLLPHPPPAEPYFHAQDLGVDTPPGASASGPGQERGRNESDSSSGESETGSDSGHHEDLLTDLLREASQSESDPDGDGEQTGHSKGKGTMSLKQHRNRYEVPAANIAVLMLACWTMRMPVMYIDFIRLIEAYTLPYLDPVRLLPPEMTRHLGRDTISSLSPHFPPNVFALHALTSRLARLCWSTYGIHSPEVNAAPLLWRSVRAMCGTSTLYGLTKAIGNVLALPLTLDPSLAPALVQAKRRDPRRHKSDNIPAELALVATVTVVLKLVYGLDGVARRAVNPGDPACALPCLEDYLKRLREAVPEPDLYSATRHTPVTDLDNAQLDEYLGFCERALLGDQVPDKSVAEFFPLTGRGEEEELQGARDGGEPGSGAEMRPSGPVIWSSDVVQAGSAVRVYNTLDLLGTLPAQYVTVLEAGARTVGVRVEDVGQIVERFERRLIRWAENARAIGENE